MLFIITKLNVIKLFFKVVSLSYYLLIYLFIIKLPNLKSVSLSVSGVCSKCFQLTEVWLRITSFWSFHSYNLYVKFVLLQLDVLEADKTELAMKVSDLLVERMNMRDELGQEKYDHEKLRENKMALEAEFENLNVRHEKLKATMGVMSEENHQLVEKQVIFI